MPIDLRTLRNDHPLQAMYLHALYSESQSEMESINNYKGENTVNCNYCNNPINEDNSDPIYYRILLGRDNKLTVACLQWFDEHDYDQDKFLDEVQYHCMNSASSRISELYEENKETAFAQLFDAPSLFQVLKQKIKENVI